MTFNKLATSLAAATLLALGASTASAAPVNVGGVIWDTEAASDFLSIGTINESVVTLAGQSIAGYGNFNEFNDNPVGVFCPGCELTYTFSGYSLLNNLVGNIGEAFGFTGGILNIYVDNSPEYSALNPASASDGALFLSLVGNAAAFASLGYINGETLIGSLTVPNSEGLGGEGEGYLDVTGGLAAAYFDTNTEAGGADLTYTSTFLPRPGGPIAGIYTHSGGIVATGDTQPIPEPGVIALLGLGLAGIGAARRMKKSA